MTGIKTTIWKSFLFFVAFAVTISILVVPFMKFVDRALLPSVSRLGQDIISFIAILFASWFIIKFFDKKPISIIGFYKDNILKDTLVGIAIGLFWVGMSLFGQFILGTLERNVVAQISSADFILSAFALLLNASTQEILCRGYLFQTIKNNIGIKAAIIITSLLFLLMHGGALNAGIIPSLNVLGAGIIFAIATYKTGQLWMPIALHFTWNFMYSSILYKPITGYNGLQLYKTKGNVLLAGGENGVEATIITTFTIIFIILIELYFLKHQTKKN